METAKILPRFGLLPSEHQEPTLNVKKDEPLQFDLLNYRPDISVMKDMKELLQAGREPVDEKNDWN